MGQLGIAQRWSPHLLWRFPGHRTNPRIVNLLLALAPDQVLLEPPESESSRDKETQTSTYLIVSHHIISYLIVSYHSLSYFIRSYHISTYLTISCHILSCFVISRLLLWESYYICVYAKRCLLLDGQRNWFCFATTTSWDVLGVPTCSNRRASWALLSEVWTELNFVGRSEGVNIQNSSKLLEQEIQEWVLSYFKYGISSNPSVLSGPHGPNLWWWWWCFCSWRDRDHTLWTCQIF